MHLFGAVIQKKGFTCFFFKPILSDVQALTAAPFTHVGWAAAWAKKSLQRPDKQMRLLLPLLLILGWPSVRSDYVCPLLVQLNSADPLASVPTLSIEYDVIDTIVVGGSLIIDLDYYVEGAVVDASTISQLAMELSVALGRQATAITQGTDGCSSCDSCDPICECVPGQWSFPCGGGQVSLVNGCGVPSCAPSGTPSLCAAVNPQCVQDPSLGGHGVAPVLGEGELAFVCAPSCVDDEARTLRVLGESGGEACRRTIDALGLADDATACEAALPNAPLPGMPLKQVCPELCGAVPLACLAPNDLLVPRVTLVSSLALLVLAILLWPVRERLFSAGVNVFGKLPLGGIASSLAPTAART